MVGARQAAIRAALAGLALSAVLLSVLPSVLSVLLSVLAGCSAYDPDKLPAQGALSPRAGGGGRSGSGGAGGTSGMGGAGGTSGVGGGDVTVVGCGDGVVSPAEKCDTKIAAGAMGACPTACPAVIMGTACVTRRLEGTACQAECTDLPGTCTNGDGCCIGPPCTSQTDDDCSASCGNGVVESEMGETCEPLSADGGVASGGDAGTVICPSDKDCDDDDDCTVDSVLGSAKTCNAHCLHTEIASAVDQDGCCPDGANSIADDDCPIKCGNDVVEEGEECDGSDGCDDDCKVMLTPEQQQCLGNHVVDGSPSEECQRCACIQCPTEVLDCRADSNATRASKCNTLINCALNHDCTGNACFCGTDAICLAPNGPCQAESAAAADEPTAAPNLITVYDRCNETNKPGMYACARANQLGVCAAMKCASCPQP